MIATEKEKKRVICKKKYFILNNDIIGNLANNVA